MRPMAKLLSLACAVTMGVWSLAAAAEKQQDKDSQGRRTCESRLLNPLDNQGGADDFGYVFVDNQTGDTATFDWIELDSDPNAVSLTFNGRDDGYSPYVPFAVGFPFYGITQDSFCVTTNGTIQFTSHSAMWDDG